MNKDKELSPFKGRLVDSELTIQPGKLKEVVGDSRNIIRLKEGMGLNNFIKAFGDWDANIATREELWKLDKRNHKGGTVQVTLEERIRGTLLGAVSGAKKEVAVIERISENVDFPVSFFIGNIDKSEPIVYVRFERIQGKSADDEGLTKSNRERIEEIFVFMAKYLMKKYQDGGLYLDDIYKLSQYILTKKGSISLVDGDFYTRDIKDGILDSFNEAVSNMIKTERRVGIRMQEARKAFVNLLRDIGNDEKITSQQGISTLKVIKTILEEQG